MEKGEHAFACPPHLPPRDAWKVNPDKIKKFYAPTDDRGFVKPDATIEMIKGLFEDDYEWPIDFSHQETRPDLLIFTGMHGCMHPSALRVGRFLSAFANCHQRHA